MEFTDNLLEKSDLEFLVGKIFEKLSGGNKVIKTSRNTERGIQYSVGNGLFPSDPTFSPNDTVLVETMSHGNKIYVASNMKEVMNYVKELLGKGKIFTEEFDYTGLPIEVYAYPNFDKKALDMKAIPSQDGKIEIVRGEYAITSANDNNPLLSTVSWENDELILMYDPKTKIGALARIDGNIPDYFKEYVPTVEKMLKDLEALGVDKKNLIIKGRNLDLFFKEGLPNMLGLPAIRKELPSKFNFNTKTGKIEDYTPLKWELAIMNRSDRLKNAEYKLDNGVAICSKVYPL